MRVTFLITIGIVLFGTIGLLIISMQQLKPFEYDITHQRKLIIKTLMPVLITFTKIGINILQQVTYQASFLDDSIFPYLKRVSAIGVCNFFARLFTLLAPLAAEQDKPLPECYLLLAVVVSFLVAYSLPLDDYDDGESII